MLTPNTSLKRITVNRDVCQTLLINNVDCISNTLLTHLFLIIYSAQIESKRICSWSKSTWHRGRGIWRKFAWIYMRKSWQTVAVICVIIRGWIPVERHSSGARTRDRLGQLMCKRGYPPLDRAAIGSIPFGAKSPRQVIGEASFNSDWSIGTLLMIDRKFKDSMSKMFPDTV